MIGLEEIKRARLAALGVCKLNAVFAHERRLFKLLQNTHALKRPVGVGHQRFADVMAREVFFLEQDHTAAFACEDACDAAPRRAAAHYDYIIGAAVVFHYELVYLSS